MTVASVDSTETSPVGSNFARGASDYHRASMGAGYSGASGMWTRKDSAMGRWTSEDRTMRRWSGNYHSVSTVSCVSSISGISGVAVGWTGVS
ncbi:hypothetical protein K0M31_005008 [Melipona bicolor]|uniref:Uncharacterized protein n=1 Tax=Melipona bicolor TaxID=60889 RepID=A0AA40KMY7_9HYME|nr:hypothetical protein K0M31_005008 [Melipona bicolor]